MNDVLGNLDSLTLEGAATALRRRTFSPVELLEAMLGRIDALEPGISAFVVVSVDAARDTAQRAADEIATGNYRGALHGIPIALKDLFDVAKLPATASSKVRADYFPLADAHVVTRLKESGAILIGKAHTYEFADGGITPRTHNPWNSSRVAGGSSGGPAAAVASGEALAALGTDAAGSIGIPSSCCGVVGLKPTYDRVSRHGVTPLSPSLDHVGPLARTVRDAALVLQVIAGFDEQDPSSSQEPVPDYLAAIEGGVQGLRVGLPENYFVKHCSPAVPSGVEELARGLEAQGAELVSFVAPGTASYSDVEFTIAMAEASAFHEEMMKERGALYLDETRTRLEDGLKIRAVDYLRALDRRRELATAWRRVFRDFDVTLTPSLPNVAPHPEQSSITWTGEFSESLDSNLTRLNCPHNLTGQPALSLRCGFEAGLPLGAQFVGRAFNEATVLRAARAAEKLIGPWDQGPFSNL